VLELILVRDVAGDGDLLSGCGSPCRPSQAGALRLEITSFAPCAAIACDRLRSFRAGDVATRPLNRRDLHRSSSSLCRELHGASYSDLQKHLEAEAPKLISGCTLVP
jgi:hypothetical protein